MATAAAPTAIAASRAISLDTISDTWLKLTTSNGPKLSSRPASISSRSEGGAGPMGGPAGPSSSPVRMMKPPSRVVCTRASSWPSSAITSRTSVAPTDLSSNSTVKVAPLLNSMPGLSEGAMSREMMPGSRMAAVSR